MPSRDPVCIDDQRHAPHPTVTWALPTRRASIRLARRMATALQVGDLLLLNGELGIGKTFLTRALCRALEIPEDVAITSPTFTLINEHAGHLPILHADLYRLGDKDRNDKDRSEVERLGLRERRSDSLLIVEWGAPHVAALGGAEVQLSLSYKDDLRHAQLTTSPAALATFQRIVEAIGLHRQA